MPYISPTQLHSITKIIQVAIITEHAYALVDFIIVMNINMHRMKRDDRH